MDQEQINKIEEDIKLALDRIIEIPNSIEISLEEDIEITKTKILYLIYQNLKGINEKLNNIINKENGKR